MSGETSAKGFPFIRSGKANRAVVICHRNADADAYLSAIALSSLIRKIFPECEVEIATPGGMTTLTSRLSRRFPHTIADGSGQPYDLYVAVDVGDSDLLQEWKDKMTMSDGMRVLVDHHPLRDSSAYDHVIVDEQATSAAEVVFGIYTDLGIEIGQDTAQALLEAIMFDSSHLAIAGPNGLRVVVTLLDSGADLALARRELRSEPDYGEVLAKLKGAQRLKIYKVGDWVVSTSSVGSFQAHVARSMIYLGADVAIVGGEAEGETRVSLRSTQKFAEKTGIHMGTQVAEEVASRLSGHGGGHATAASFTGEAGEEDAIADSLKRISELIGGKPSEIG